MNSVTEGKVLEVICPATGEVIATIDETPIEEVEKMYENAREAFLSWSALSIKQRIGYLVKLREYMVDHMDEISETVSKDTGKVKVEALIADVMTTLDAISHIEKHAEKVLSPQRVATPILLFGKKSYIEYMPRGVVLVISPWNYPLQLSMVPMISALIGGNTVILKPSEVTPLVGKCIEELFEKAGFPKHVVQVAHGGKELGAALTSKKPDYIFFTGSVRTGKIIQAQAAKDLIPTTLELGGKDPAIVFADANLARAAKGVVWGAFTNSGQVCMSSERLYVEVAVYHEFISLLKEEVANLKQGTSHDDDIGSMTFPGQLTIIEQQLKSAISEGASLVTGEDPKHWETKKGWFIPPTIITNVTNEMEIVQEESFGPILPVIPFETEDEAIRLANDSVYGLNASVWSLDIAKARRVASKLVSGNVVVNDVMVTVGNHGLPFGGTKQSGVGRYHGEQGLRIFCHEKAIMVDNGNSTTEIQWYPYKNKYNLFLNLFKGLFGKKKDWKMVSKYYLKLKKMDKKS
ncbi:aldehyde dehydrogenase family protein [Bacillus timonensis]|nr:aldehyde dehydrogenase family protein [Bacillus timonensis]